MVDISWSTELTPTAQTFFFAENTGRNLLAQSKKQTIYQFAKPLWITELTFKGGYAGTPTANNRKADFAVRIQAELAKLKGGLNRSLVFDFYRRNMRGSDDGSGLGNSAVTAGDEDITVTGGTSGQVIARQGDLIGGDGRPHIVLNTTVAGGGGSASVDVWPPFETSIGVDAAVFQDVTGTFRIDRDSLSRAMKEVGQATTMTLTFLEDLS